jgi:hypothetical protein
LEKLEKGERRENNEVQGDLKRKRLLQLALLGGAGRLGTGGVEGHPHEVRPSPSPGQLSKNMSQSVTSVNIHQAYLS